MCAAPLEMNEGTHSGKSTICLKAFSVGGRDVCRFQPAYVSATNIEILLPEAVLIQFVSPDDEHDVFETCR